MILESLPLLDLIRLNLTSSQQNVDADEGDESSVVQAPTEPLYRLSRSDTAKVDWLERNVYVDTHTQEAGTVTLDMDAVSLSSSSDSFALCHIANYGTLTLGNAIPTPTGHKELVGVALALQHLNTGDGSVIKQVQDLHKRCNVKFTLEIKDDELDRAVAVKNTLEYLDRPPQDAQNRRPCAFLGARSSDFTGRTAMLTSIQDYLHVGPLLFAPDLDDPNLFPLFARTSSTEHDTSVAFVHLLNQWNIKRFAVINRNDAWGNELADTLRQAIAHHALDIEMHQIPLDDRPQSITQAIQALKRTQYQYVYVAIYNLNNAFDRLMQEAVHQNVAGNGIHTWFFHGTIVDALNKPYPKDSDLAKAYHGIGTVALISYIPTRDPSLPRTPGDAFLEALRELYNPEDVQYLNSIFPHEQHQNSPKFNQSIQSVQNGVFIQEIASPEGYVRGEGMYYDATMAIGLAACDAMAKHGANFTGKQHYDALTANTFEGVTGTVLFNSTTGNRDPSTVTYTVTNRIAKEVNETHVVFDPVFTHKLIDRQWKPFPGTEFIFNNGETAIPLDIPAITTQDNAISPAVRGTVLGMCAVSILLAICLSTWAVRHKFTHVVRASQPFFLHSISIGTIIFASAIIPMSMDQGVLDEDGATVACNATVWLVSLGFCVTFSALFTKNYRINKILTSSTSMRRINVSLLDVAIPMMCLVSVNAIILAVMTALAPIQFETEVVSEDIFERPTETLSQCAFGKDQLPYIAVLIIINFGCLLVAILQAYQARHLSTEFGESQYLFLSFVLSLLTVLIGVPILILARDNNTSATTFIGSAMIFVTCVSVLTFMYVPKIRYLKQNGNKADRFRLAINLIAAKTTGGSERHRDRDSSSNNNERVFSSERFQMGNCVVSGLEEDRSAFFTIPQDSNSNISASGHGGIQVYTSNTKEELILQVETLKIENARLRRRVNFLAVPGNHATVTHHQSVSSNTSTTMAQEDSASSAFLVTAVKRSDPSLANPLPFVVEGDSKDTDHEA